MDTSHLDPLEIEKIQHNIFAEERASSLIGREGNRIKMFWKKNDTIN